MKKFIENHAITLVAVLLLVKLVIGLFLSATDSAIVDEIAHIPAGYSYVEYSDYRLNPEHPPLLKDLAGIALQFIDATFPQDHISWTEDVNGQWESGWHFLYHYGNNADLIVFAARLPLLLLSIGFGFLIFFLTRKFFGSFPAVLATFFYALSPNFLAHSHFVTTDMGIAFAVFLSLSTFAIFVKNPSKKTLALATFGLFVAHITKFSSVLLVPFYFLGLVFVIIATTRAPKIFAFEKQIKGVRTKAFTSYALSYILLVTVSLLAVWGFYAFHTANFPPDKQIELTEVSLGWQQYEPEQTTVMSQAELIKLAISGSTRKDAVREELVRMTGSRILQPLAQYFLGVAMVFTRVSGGNTTFFLGEVNNQSFKWYFPVSYLLKTPLSLLMLLMLAIVLSANALLKRKIKTWWATFKKFLIKRPEVVIFFMFTLYYTGISISGNLNLGIRHLFPVLPLIYILVAYKTDSFFDSFKTNTGHKIAVGVFGVLVFWFAASSLSIFPNYLSYFNEIIGGGRNGYKYFTDSNIDWGQDLKRLAVWTDNHPEVDRLRLDYFGGGEPRYLFCTRKQDNNGSLIRSSNGYNCENSRYIEWHSNYGQIDDGWVAVSVTFLQNAKFYAERFGEQDYEWLLTRQPYAKIGNSIFVYKVEPGQ